MFWVKCDLILKFKFLIRSRSGFDGLDFSLFNNLRLALILLLIIGVWDPFLTDFFVNEVRGAILSIIGSKVLSNRFQVACTESVSISKHSTERASSNKFFEYFDQFLFQITLDLLYFAFTSKEIRVWSPISG